VQISLTMPFPHQSGQSQCRHLLKGERITGRAHTASERQEWCIALSIQIGGGVAGCGGIERQITVAMQFPHDFACRSADSHSKAEESDGGRIEAEEEDGMLRRTVDSNRWRCCWLRRNRKANHCGHAVSP
jgi:hypothetical protein